MVMLLLARPSDGTADLTSVTMSAQLLGSVESAPTTVPSRAPWRAALDVARSPAKTMPNEIAPKTKGRTSSVPINANSTADAPSSFRAASRRRAIMCSPSAHFAQNGLSIHLPIKDLKGSVLQHLTVSNHTFVHHPIGPG